MLGLTSGGRGELDEACQTCYEMKSDDADQEVFERRYGEARLVEVGESNIDDVVEEHADRVEKIED